MVNPRGYNIGAIISSIMRKPSEFFFSVILVPLDFVALLSAFVVAYTIRVKFEGKPVAHSIPPLEFLQIVIILLPIWILIFALSGLYAQSSLRGRWSELGKVFVAVSGGVMFTILLDFLQPTSIFPSKAVPVYAYALGLVFVMAYRLIVRALQRALFNFGVGVHNALIIGSGEIAREIRKGLADPSSGYRLLGCVDTAKNAGKRMPGLPIYQSFEEALQMIGKTQLDEIIQADSGLRQDEVMQLVSYATNNHLAYRFVPNQFGLYAINSSLASIAGVPMIEIQLTPLEGWGRIAKRAFDLVGAGVLIIILSPLLLLLAILVKIKEPDGPILFRHKRLSRNGEDIYVIKFRTMLWRYCDGPGRQYKNAIETFKAMGREDLIQEFEKNQKVENDPRVSRFGRLLRKTSLDELPQLFNVLKGDLSMVGPRPILPAELQHYGTHSAGLLALKPGITGLWQISGRNSISYDDRVKLDIYYVENWSLLLDLRIIFKTIASVLTGRGAY